MGINRFMRPAEMQVQSAYTPLPLDWMYNMLQQKQGETDSYNSAISTSMPESTTEGLSYMKGLDPVTGLYKEYNDVKQWNQGIVEKNNAKRTQDKQKMFEALNSGKGDYSQVVSLLQQANLNEKKMQEEEKGIAEVKKNYEKQLETISGKELDENYQMLPVFQNVGKYIQSHQAGIDDNTFNPVGTSKYFDMQDEVLKNKQAMNAADMGFLAPVLREGKDFYTHADFSGVSGDRLENMTKNLFNANPKFKNTLDEKWLYNTMMDPQFESYYSIPELTTEKRRVYDKNGKDTGKMETVTLTPYQAYLKDEKLKLISYARGFEYQTANRGYGLNPNEQKKRNLQIEKDFNEANRAELPQVIQNMDIKDMDKEMSGKYTWLERLMHPGTWFESNSAKNALDILKDKIPLTVVDVPDIYDKDGKMINKGRKGVGDFINSNWNNPDVIKQEISRLEKVQSDNLRGMGVSESEIGKSLYDVKKVYNMYLNAKQAENIVNNPVSGTINYYKNVNPNIATMLNEYTSTIPGIEKKTKKEQETIMDDAQNKINTFQNIQSSKYGLTKQFNENEGKTETDRYFGSLGAINKGERLGNGVALGSTFSWIRDGKKVSGKTYDDFVKEFGEDAVNKINIVGYESIATTGKNDNIQTAPRVAKLPNEPGTEIYIGKDFDEGINMKSMPYKSVFNSYSGVDNKVKSPNTISNISGIDMSKTKNVPDKIIGYEKVMNAYGLPIDVLVTGDTKYNQNIGAFENDKHIYLLNPINNGWIEVSYPDFKQKAEEAIRNSNTKWNVKEPSFNTENPNQTTTTRNYTTSSQ